MADIIEFKSSKKHLKKKWKAEIDAEIKKEDWYMAASKELDYRIGYLKIIMVIDAILVIIALICMQI
jgi:hypothetical protein